MHVIQIHFVIGDDMSYNNLLFCLQSQLDIPFKVRAGHIGETEVNVPMCYFFLGTEETFSYFVCLS